MANEMQKHFVTFYSPGTFVSESTTKPIDSWDVEKAVKMAMTISERHGARPYGFQFSTRERRADELDSRQAKTSGIYYLGGKVLTLANVEARKDPNDNILISNMKCNKIAAVVENCNSYRSTMELRKGDVVLDVTLPPLKKEK